jgi:hypothetical protein
LFHLHNEFDEVLIVLLQTREKLTRFCPALSEVLLVETTVLRKRSVPVDLLNLQTDTVVVVPFALFTRRISTNSVDRKILVL